MQNIGEKLKTELNYKTKKNSVREERKKTYPVCLKFQFQFRFISHTITKRISQLHQH